MLSLLPFMLFALVSSITPGPTNLLILSQSARLGLMAAMPPVIGASAGAALMVLASGCGLAEVLERIPLLRLLLTVAGLGWLTWLAVSLYRADPTLQRADRARLGVLDTAAMQLINPKSWTMALAVIAVFAGAEPGPTHLALLALLFFLVAVPCLTCWAVLGSGSARWLEQPARLRLANRGMALLLLVSTWAGILLQGPLSL